MGGDASQPRLYLPGPCCPLCAEERTSAKPGVSQSVLRFDSSPNRRQHCHACCRPAGERTPAGRRGRSSHFFSCGPVALRKWGRCQGLAHPRRKVISHRKGKWRRARDSVLWDLGLPGPFGHVTGAQSWSLRYQNPGVWSLSEPGCSAPALHGLQVLPQGGKGTLPVLMRARGP